MKGFNFKLSRLLRAKRLVNKNKPVVRQFNWFTRSNEPNNLNENQR